MKRTTLIAFIAGGVVLVLLWYFLLFAPTSKDLSDTRKQVASAENQKQELENTIRHLKELSKNAPQQAASLRTLRAAIPSTPDLGAFILAANDIATESGIDFLAISPSPPVANTAGGPPTMIALSIQVNGGFFEVLDYLNRLEDLDRLVLVDTVDISSGGDSTSAGGSTTGDSSPGDSSSSGSSGAAPDLSVTLTGRMFTDAPPPAGTTPGAPSVPTTPTTTPGSTTPTTPPASSSGTSS